MDMAFTFLIFSHFRFLVEAISVKSALYADPERFSIVLSYVVIGR